MKKKVAFHGSYGGFGLTPEAVRWMINNGLPDLDPVFCDEWLDPTYPYGDNPPEVTRDNPVLIRCIETLGERAGKNLKIAEIDTEEFHITEYDGWETVRPAIRVNGKKYALIDEDIHE